MLSLKKGRCEQCRKNKVAATVTVGAYKKKLCKPCTINIQQQHSKKPYNLCVCGAQCGKTSFVNRLVRDRFNESGEDETLENEVRWETRIGGVKAQCTLLDVSGNDCYRDNWQRWFKSVEGFVVFFAVDDTDSFALVEPLVAAINHCLHQDDLPLVIVGTRADTTSRVVSRLEAEALAKRFSAPYFECSARTGTPQRLAAPLHACIRLVARDRGEIGKFPDAVDLSPEAGSGATRTADDVGVRPAARASASGAHSGGGGGGANNMVMMDESNTPALRKALSASNVAELRGSGTASRSDSLRESIAAEAAHDVAPQQWLPYAELNIGEKLGTGTSGDVFAAVYQGDPVAVKVLRDLPDGREVDEFKKELRIMAAIRHAHIVHFYGLCAEPSLCLVMELCERGSLFNVLNTVGTEAAAPEVSTLTWPRAYDFAYQCSAAVAALHEHDVVHRDLKSLNMLVTRDWRVKVCDFGLARRNTATNIQTLSKVVGTYAYIAPEVYHEKPFSFQSDVYALAFILWEIGTTAATGKYELPYSEFNIQLDFKIVVKAADENLRPSIDERFGEQLRELIARCWQGDAHRRPTASQVLFQLRQLCREHRLDAQGGGKTTGAASLSASGAGEYASVNAAAAIGSPRREGREYGDVRAAVAAVDSIVYSQLPDADTKKSFKYELPGLPK